MERSANAMGVLWAYPRKQEEVLGRIRSDEIRPVSGISDSSAGLGITVEEGEARDGQWSSHARLCKSWQVVWIS